MGTKAPPPTLDDLHRVAESIDVQYELSVSNTESDYGYSTEIAIEVGSLSIEIAADDPRSAREAAYGALVEVAGEHTELAALRQRAEKAEAELARIHGDAWHAEIG